jgi:hypothetical protein
MSEIKCPKCEHAFNVEPSLVMNDCVLHMILKQESGRFMTAKALGGMLIAMEKLLVSSGKSLGAAMAVAVRNITFKGEEIDVEFCVMHAKNDGAKP